MKEKLSFKRRFFEILAETYLDSFNGTVTVTRADNTRKSVSVMFGKVISASSNARIDRLELWFYRKKLLDKDEIAKFSHVAKSKKISFWKAIVLSKRFSDAQLNELISERIYEIMYDLSTWTEGEVELEEGEYIGGDLPNMDIDIPIALREILKRLPKEELIAYLKTKGNTVVASEEIQIEITQEEEKILQKVQHPRTLDVIISRFPPYAVVFLYIFRALSIKEVKLDIDETGMVVEENEKDSRKEARELFEKGMAKYREGNYGEALLFFKEAVKLDNSVADYYTALGLTYATEWDGHEPEIKKAATAFKKATEIDPGNPRNYFYLGEVLKHVGKIDQAKKYFERAVHLKPDYEPAKNELKRIG